MSEEPSITSVFVIAQLMFAHRLPTDLELTEEQANVLAHNADLAARALLKRPIGVAYLKQAEMETEQ